MNKLNRFVGRKVVIDGIEGTIVKPDTPDSHYRFAYRYRMLGKVGSALDWIEGVMTTVISGSALRPTENDEPHGTRHLRYDADRATGIVGKVEFVPEHETMEHGLYMIELVRAGAATHCYVPGGGHGRHE